MPIRGHVLWCLHRGSPKPLAFSPSPTCDRVQDPEPPPPLMGEGRDGGDKGFIVYPHPHPPPSKGEGIIAKFQVFLEAFD